MKIKSSLLSFTFLLFLASAPIAQAGEILFVSPTRVFIDETNKTATMNVTNMSDVSRTYELSIENVAMTESGSSNVVDDFPYSAKKMLKFFPRQFTVQPGQRQTVRIMAKIPADTPDGEYHAHIEYLEDAKKQGDVKNEDGALPGQKAALQAPVSYSALIPIVVRKGKVETSVDWADPVVVPVAGQKNVYDINMELTRTGNGQGNAYFDIIYVAPDGKETMTGPRRTAYVYREVDKRKNKLDYIIMPEGATSAGKIKLRLLTGEKTNPVLVHEVLLAIP